nr:hypothetical protein HmN_000946400 [Hymenolepis microstoma]
MSNVEEYVTHNYFHSYVSSSSTDDIVLHPQALIFRLIKLNLYAVYDSYNEVLSLFLDLQLAPPLTVALRDSEQLSGLVNILQLTLVLKTKRLTVTSSSTLLRWFVGDLLEGGVKLVSVVRLVISIKGPLVEDVKVVENVIPSIILVLGGRLISMASDFVQRVPVFL